MLERERDIHPSEYQGHTPFGEEEARSVMASVAQMTASEVAGVMKVSASLAAKVVRMAYEFPDKSRGMEAIEAFNGVVFKALAYSALSDEEKARADGKVRLISSLYGWLRPADIVKPYRFDFTTPLAPGGLPFAQFWRKDTTIRLVKHLQESGENAILDLLPSDAAKTIDWKLVKRFAKVWKVDFKELKPGGVMKTPHAGKLKELRGTLLRDIITHRIDNPADLLTYATDSLLPLGTPDYPTHIAFCI